MSQQNLGIKAFIAGTDLEAYRRVKLSGGSGGDTVIYAQAGEACIGITAKKTASGDFVSVTLRDPGQTLKFTASKTISAGAAFYGSADGKISDVASGASLGTLLEAAGGDGEIVEGIIDNGTGSVGDGASTAIAAEDANGSIPVIFKKEGITDAHTADVTIVTSMPFKARIIRWWLISRDTTASNINLKNGASDATGVTAKGTANDAIVQGGAVIAAQKDLAHAAALKVSATVAAAFDVFVQVMRVS